MASLVASSAGQHDPSRRAAWRLIDNEGLSQESPRGVITSVHLCMAGSICLIPW